jgi:hypothetical protein
MRFYKFSLGNSLWSKARNFSNLSMLYFQLMSLTKCIAVLPVNTVNSLQAVYVYNMNSGLKEYIKINERFFSHFKVGMRSLLKMF